MSNNSFLPPQIGYLPSGYAGNSQFWIGRNLGTTPNSTKFDAIGFGGQLRPEIANQVIINLSYTPNINAQVIDANANTTVGTIILDVNDLQNILYGINSNPNAPNVFNLKLTEVSVCSGDGNGNNTEVKMIVLGSQLYLPNPNS